MTRRFRTSALAALALLALSTRPAAAIDSDGDGIPDDVDALPCDPQASAITYAPAKSQFGMVLFEDLWPSNGDLDFNDQNVAYNFVHEVSPQGKVVALQATFSILSLGASLHNGMYLHLPLPSGAATSITRISGGGVPASLSPMANEHELVVQVAADTFDLMGGQQGFVNTTSSRASVPAGAVTIVIRFATPVTLDHAQAPYDLFIARTGAIGHQIHQPQYSGTDTMDTSLFGQVDDGSNKKTATADNTGRWFVNTRGLPYALNVPTLVKWPLETVSIERLYPDLTAFGTSAGTTHQDWYKTNVQAAFAWTGGAGNTPAPTPSSVVAWPLIDTSCVQAWKGTEEFGGSGNLIPFKDVVDTHGNIYAAGYYYLYGHNEAFVAKFDSVGNQLWLNQYGDPSSFGNGIGLAVDAQDNVFITGWTQGAFGGQQHQSPGYGSDMFVTKINSSGNMIWNRQFGGSQTWGYGQGWDVAADGAGGVYAAGGTNITAFGGDTAPNTRALVVHIKTDGTVDWAKGYSLPTGTNWTYAFPYGIGVDSTGNLSVLVQRYSQSIGNYVPSLMRLDSHGAFLGTTDTRLAAGESSKWPFRAAFSPDGSATYAGYTFQYPYIQALVERVAPGTGLAWEAVLSNTSYSYGYGVATFGDGGAALSGFVYGALSGQTDQGNGDYFVARTDAAGRMLWVHQDGTSGTEEALGVCVDPAGGSYVVGYNTGALPGSHGSGTGFLVKYSADGTKQ